MIHEADLLTAEWVQSAQVLARWTARTERVSSHQLHHEPRTKRSERGVQLMASDKATQCPANGFSFRGLTSYLANNNTQTNSDFSSPVAESSAADRPSAPATLGGRESVSGCLQRLCLQRSQLLRSVRSGGVPARKGQAACRLVVVAQSPFASTGPLGAWAKPHAYGAGD